MKKIIIICFVCCCAFAKAYSQELSASEVLEKSINFHDPNGNWPAFQGEFKLALDMPDKPTRTSTITIDLLKEYFNVSTEQDGKTSFREINGSDCKFTEESGEVTAVAIDDDACERTKMYRDYYSYLYGLPMKLKDTGTVVDPQVKEISFKGKDYLVVRVSYDENVGSDIWQFYFNPETYAMEVYQFFKGTDETTGEYILLSGMQTVNGIKMPKDRAWYYNKDDGYLGTDKMVQK